MTSEERLGLIEVTSDERLPLVDDRPLSRSIFVDEERERFTVVTFCVTNFLWAPSTPC